MGAAWATKVDKVLCVRRSECLRCYGLVDLRPRRPGAARITEQEYRIEGKGLIRKQPVDHVIRFLNHFSIKNFKIKKRNKIKTDSKFECSNTTAKKPVSMNVRNPTVENNRLCLNLVSNPPSMKFS